MKSFKSTLEFVQRPQRLTFLTPYPYTPLETLTMSDLFNSTNGAMGIISLGLTIAQGLFRIADGIGSAGREVRGYAQEINTFSKLLKYIKAELDSSADVSINIQSLINDVVDICDRVLTPFDHLHKLLSPLLDQFCTCPNKLRQLGLRLQWMFKTKAKLLFYRETLKEQHRILDTILEIIILQRMRRDCNLHHVGYVFIRRVFIVQLHSRISEIDSEDSSPATLATARDLQLLDGAIYTPLLLEGARAGHRRRA